MSDGYVFIDTETNGRGPRARVIEIALIQTSLTGERQKEFTALIRGTGYSGGKRLVAIHHITDEMIKNERDFKDVWVEISPMIQNRTIVAHNAAFDQGMINRELERIGESPIGDFLCTLKLARFLGLAYRKSAQSEGASGKLGALATRLGLDVKPDHRALADTHALAAVFWKMNAMYPQKVAEYTKLQQRSRLITKSPVVVVDSNNKTSKSFHQGLRVVINPTLDAGFILDIQSLLPDGDAFIIDMAKCDPSRKEFRSHQKLWFKRLNAYSKIAARAISHFWTTDGELIVSLSEGFPERLADSVMTAAHFSNEDSFARFDLALLTGANLSGANLDGTNFFNANMTNTNLIGANLTGADLAGANLRGANLKGAIMPDGTIHD
jgi:DNA polymerase III epsilon subunit family exonuclease